MKFQHFNGVKFTKDDKTGYYLNSTLRKRLHRYIWEYYNGEIPKGYQIHHIDGDKNNNNINNLEAIHKVKHATLHSKEKAEKYYDRMINNLDKNARPKASEWHGSEQGKEWHKEQYQKTKDKLHETKEYICEHCGHKYTTTKKSTNKFCSNKCKSAHRRESGVDNEERKCFYCGQTFITNKYYKTQCCSKACSNKMWPRKK